ncbi:hypothetical protein [Pelagovum pacificum]|uniref:Uncharacterized protein n=1 Tax=Pelagovum pacificum TaxID=2588711 RepID=A0A5C5GC93_9RHOB|nr:hypothetical protein [Pelagovum pacificum]QQA41453.1 hypothetical protein I8N54_11490 [Pelagovum pacificum]TNY31744.1 hypothetical protein FHY64_00115 [Pelagovum pacificum]
MPARGFSQPDPGTVALIATPQAPETARSATASTVRRYLVEAAARADVTSAEIDALLYIAYAMHEAARADHRPFRPPLDAPLCDERPVAGPLQAPTFASLADPLVSADPVPEFDRELATHLDALTDRVCYRFLELVQVGTQDFIETHSTAWRTVRETGGALDGSLVALAPADIAEDGRTFAAYWMG